MENRRQTTATGPFGQKKFYDRNRDNDRNKDGDNNRDNNRNRINAPNQFGRFQNRENGDRFQNRPTGDRFPSRENNPRFQSRDDRNRDDRNRQDRASRNDPRGDYRKGPDKFFPKGPNKFQPNKRLPGKSFKQPWKTENNIKVVSDLQITDGKYKGKYLQNSASPGARVTVRRLREIMFRILFRRVRAGRVLDLCAGAGTIGFEAISRGAMVSTFIDRSAKMCSFIKKNLEALSIKEGHGEVFESEALPFLKKMAKRRRHWDVAYFGPPYDSNYEEVLDYFGRGTALKPGGLLVVEHHAEMFFPEKTGVLKRWRVIVQGDIALSFYERK